MYFTREAEKYLESNNPHEIQKGLGYALLALAKEIRDQPKFDPGSLKLRKAEIGDTKIIYCDICGKNTEHVFGGVTDISRWWQCTRCENEIRCF